MNSGIVCRKCQRLGRAACFCWLEWGEVVPIRQVDRPPEEEAGAKASGARKAGENRREKDASSKTIECGINGRDGTPAATLETRIAVPAPPRSDLVPQTTVVILNPLPSFTLHRFSGIKRECQMNARHRLSLSPSRALRAAATTVGWLAKFETSPAKLGCQSRGVSCSGRQRIRPGAAITSTGAFASASRGSRDLRTPRVDTARGNGARR